MSASNLFFWVLRLKASVGFTLVVCILRPFSFLFFFLLAVSYGTRTLVIAGKIHKILIQILNAVTRFRIGSSCEAQSWFCSKHWISLSTCRRDTVFLLETGPRLVEGQIQITNSSLYLAYSFLNFHVWFVTITYLYSRKFNP